MFKTNKISTYISCLRQFSSYKKIILLNKNKKATKVNKDFYLRNIKIKPSQFLLILSSGSWHNSLINSFKIIFGNNLSHFDYRSINITPKDLYSIFGFFHRNIIEKKIENIIIKNDIKVIGGYFDGFLLRPSFLKKIKLKYNLRMFNISFDDRQSWDLKVFDLNTTYQNLKSISECFDLFFTSSKITIDWHLRENGNPIYFPEGGDTSIYKCLDSKKRDKIIFFGSKYGNRQKIINYLKKCGINIECYGSGWNKKGKLETKDIMKIIDQAFCVLGDGYVGNMDMITTLKARDFEIPMTGIPYLTSFHHELSQYYSINKDIWCYNHYTEIPLLIKQIKNMREIEFERLRLNAHNFRIKNSWVSRISFIKNKIKVEITE